MNKYLTPLDEVLLLNQGFKYGLYEETLWRKGKDGAMYCMDSSVPGEYQTWYRQQPAGNLGPSFPLSRKQFYELFG